MKTAAGLIKLKPDTQKTVEDWRATLDARRDEALQTLKDEGVAVESWFQVEIAGEPYLLWYMRAESIETVWKVASQSKHAIDAYHFDTMSKIAQSQIEAKPLLDLNT